MELAEPLLGAFYEAWHLAVNKYASTPPEFIAEHDDSCAAQNIRQYMWAEVVRRFEGRAEYHLYRLNRLNLLNHQDQTLWRFKKVDGGGRHQNYQTSQQKDYDKQRHFDGIPPSAERLTSGYQPDASGLAIERIIVARPVGSTILWASAVNFTNGSAAWEDITPTRLPGTDRIQIKRGT